MEIPNGSISFGVEKETYTVTSEIYVPYVLANFFSLFPINTTKPSIGYGHGDEALVIKNLAQSFFRTKQLRTKETIIWKPWKGDMVPFIFGNAEQPIISKENNQTIVQDDILASAFYFLSGWQEVVDTRRDGAGRFLYTYSIQKELDIAHLPVVNIYFDILRTAIEQSHGMSLENIFQCPIVCISHDIDEWATLWLQKAKKAWEIKDWSTLFKTIQGRIFNRSLTESFLPIFELHHNYDFRTSFYFLPETNKYENYTNADYDLAGNAFRSFILQLQKSGNEIGLHGSFFVHKKTTKLKQEADALPSYPIGYRSHYLVFDMDKTPNLLENAGIKYDTSLGFPDQIGWRNSCSYPFYLFDFQQLKTSSVLEIPLSIMECTLFFEKYLGLDTDSATKKCLEFVEIIEKHGGILSLLWHNSAFDNYLNPGWAVTLERIIQATQSKGIEILTGRDVLAKMKNNG